MAIQISPLIILFGAPGSGKTTFGQAHTGYELISTGNLTRNGLKDGSIDKKFEKMILTHDQEGASHTLKTELTALIQELVFKRLDEAIKSKRGVILDGYPKTAQQCQLLDQFLQANQSSVRAAFIYLQVSPETSLKRLSERLICQKCEKIYRATSLHPLIPNLCDLPCQGQLMPRADFEMENAKKRIEKFPQRMAEVFNHYKSTLKVVDANASLENILETAWRL